MKKSDTLFNARRFKWIEKSRMNELRNRGLGETIKLQKELILFYEPFRDNYRKDKPVSYKILLRKRNK